MSEEYVSKVTWREDDRNGPSSIWLHEEEEPSDTWSDTSLDNESEEEREDTIYGESKGKEKGSERKEEEYEDWREGQSIQVANISDCPLNDMERIRIVSCIDPFTVCVAILVTPPLYIGFSEKYCL